jgi:hypothetical protein
MSSIELGRVPDLDRTAPFERLEDRGGTVPLGVIPTQLVIRRGEMEIEGDCCDEEDENDSCIDCPLGTTG